MITCEWLGRLGNNMFQIAATYGLAKTFNEVAEFPYEVKRLITCMFKKMGKTYTQYPIIKKT
jgi:hypothetical protein